LEDSVDRVAAETGFSGVVRVDRGGGVQLAKAYGLAHRGCRVANAIDTQFAIASGTKGLTALTVVSLIEEGRLGPATTARSVLAEDLPLIGDEVTVEQLLAHRSGIGDYLDEESDYTVTDYVLPLPVHELATTERYLRVLGGHPGKFAPDERFSYSNSGYVVLALLAERTSGTPTSSTFRSGAAETAASTPPRPTSTPCGRRCSPGGSCRRTGSRRWCAPAAMCRRSPCVTAWGSGSTNHVPR
jgi:CubicO group peptidase (beta-lactamase class C family)